MNIDLIARIQPSMRGEGPHTLNVEGKNRISNRTGGSSVSFQYVHGQNETNHDIYRNSVEPLLDFCLAGYNTCLMVSGESGSGKTFVVAGDNTPSGSPGVFGILLQHLFNRIDGKYDGNSTSKVQLQLYEVYNETIRDLLAPGGSQADHADLDYTAEKGSHIKRSPMLITNAGEAITLFRQGITRRNNRVTDFGKAQYHSFLLAHIDISLINEAGMSTQCRMTMVVTPGIEKLAQDWQSLQLREGSTLSLSLVAWARIIESLANQPQPNRVLSYEDSKITRLLEEELGGNCRTRAVMCLKPHPDSASLDISLQLSRQLAMVKNFPISNDMFAKGLITQYRSKMQNFKPQKRATEVSDFTHGRDVQEELRRLQSQNVHLKDENERLLQRFSQMQGNFTNLVSSKTDLSAQLLMTEEEKLKVSKILVEMQIENNKAREELEATKFELKNKILKLEAELTEAELERDRHKAGNRLLQDRLSDLEADRRKLADEFVSLKSNYLAVKKAHEDEVAYSEELSLEMLNLANANAALMRDRDSASVHSHHSEVDRVRAIVSRQSHRIKFSEPDDYQPRDPGNALYEEEKKHSELQSQRLQHDDVTRKLARRLSELTRDLQRANQLAREKQRQASELKAKLLVTESVRDELQSQNNRMQHKLKDVSEDFKARLIKYVRDITEYMKNAGAGDKKEAELKQFVEQMLNDVKQAHKTREEQLSQAAQNYRRQLTDVTHKLEKLFAAYRNLRDDVKQSDVDIDLGPDEEDFKVTDQEHQSTQQKEINRLRNELREAEKQIDSLSLKVQLGGNQQATPRRREKEELSSLRKELKEFTINTQQELERERAELLTRVAMIEEENKELQDYIDSHLIRYKEEIVRLREMQGMSDAGGFISPDKSGRPGRRF